MLGDEDTEERDGKRKIEISLGGIELSEEDFRKSFPAIAEELEEEGIGLRGGTEEEEMDFSGYNPDVIDFLRRCSNDDEAMEIINWMESRGEITGEMARELRAELVRKGVRAFGSKKEWGWYDRHGR